MAFKDLREDIVDLFSEEVLHEDRGIDWQLRQRARENDKRKAERANEVLDDRLRRKRNRALADRRLPPPAQLTVACTLCRAELRDAFALHAHLVMAHAVYRGDVACRFCRLELSVTSLHEHGRRRHPVEHAAASAANHRHAAWRAHQARRSLSPVLVAVRVTARADAPVAYYRCIK